MLCVIQFKSLLIPCSGLVKCSSDFLLKSAFSLAGPASKLVLLLERFDNGAKMWADSVDHLRFRMIFMAVSARYAASLVRTVLFKAEFASGLIAVHLAD